MSINLHGRHFLKEIDFTVPEWEYLLELTDQLKRDRKQGREVQRLTGLNLALVFEKSSTRTRASFEVAARHQGADVTFLDPTGSHIGIKESAADTARVFSRLYDGIQFRGCSQAMIETMAEHSTVPVWNGLTDDWHPTQSLCDMYTMREASGLVGRDLTFAYLGDARFNQGNSLLIAGAMMGHDVRIVAPAAFQPDAQLVAVASQIADSTGAKITITDDVVAGVASCDFVHTDVWVSMGEPQDVWAERIGLLMPYQVNEKVMDATGKPDAKFMHCLPAFHDRETEVGERIFQQTGFAGLEVTNDVFESDASIVFDQAENRMHTIKAILIATLD